MQLHEAFQVMEALSPNEANRKIREGWTILAVVATTHPSGEIHPCYVMGKAEQAFKTNEQADQITASD
jgi:hypothetical protein